MKYFSVDDELILVSFSIVFFSGFCFVLTVATVNNYAIGFGAACFAAGAIKFIHACNELIFNNRWFWNNPALVLINIGFLFLLSYLAFRFFLQPVFITY